MSKSKHQTTKRPATNDADRIAREIDQAWKDRERQQSRLYFVAIDVTKLDAANPADAKALRMLVDSGDPRITARGRQCVMIEKERSKKIMLSLNGYVLTPGYDGTFLIDNGKAKS